MANSPLYIYIHHTFFFHSSVDGHLGYFHTIAVVNSAVTNIGVQNRDYQNDRKQVLMRVWREGNAHELLVRMEIGAATMENSMEVS